MATAFFQGYFTAVLFMGCVISPDNFSLNKIILLRKIALLLFLSCSALPGFTQRVSDRLSPQQSTFYIQLTKKLHHPLWPDSTRLSDRARMHCFRQPDRPVVDICYDNETYYVDSEGNKRKNFTYDGNNSVCFQYDTLNRILSAHASGMAGSYYHTAYYDDTSVVYEVFSSHVYGNQAIELYGHRNVLYKSYDTSGISFIPHPVKPGKLIAVISNKETVIQLKTFRTLTQSGKGARKRYLIEAITDSTNKLYPYTAKFYIAVYQNNFKKLAEQPASFLLELSQPGTGLIQFCDYQNYDNIVNTYPLAVDLNTIDTVYRCSVGVKLLHKLKNTNEQGFMMDAQKSFIKKSKAGNKMDCREYENFAARMNMSSQELHQQYEETFRDNFILYLNRERLGL